MVDYEIDVGYKVSVIKMFEASGTADEYGDFVVLPEPGSYVKNNTQYLVTLDVNGVNKLYRELWTSGSVNDNTNVPLSDYTYIMDEYMISDLTEDDAVVVRFEEVEVRTSDAFRAAVSKTAPKSDGGGTGGGVLVVTDTDGTLDKTAGEIMNAFNSGMVIINADVTLPNAVSKTAPKSDGGGTGGVGTVSNRYLVIFASSLHNGPSSFTCNVNGEPTYYVADSADDYPVLDSGD